MNWKMTLAGMVVALLGASAACAQLTAEDIEALRAQGQREGWTFTVGPNAATVYPLEALCGLRPALRPEVTPSRPPAVSRDRYGQAWNWEDLFPAQPVRDQGPCGSCWAFATCGVLEYRILIQERVSRDLSEQWLLSCNQHGWDCVGGWYAHVYHEASGSNDPCNDDGAVYETDFPYTALDSTPCNCPYPHHYWISGWEHLGSEVASVDDIKTALVERGPVAVSVAATSAFHAYSGGVFNACGGACSDPDNINHAVILVGWDDNQGSDGVWFLRNSWGSDWGEDGYMRIEYGCCFVGYDTNYVHYPADGRGIWVDFAYSGTETGTWWRPYNTLAEGIDAVNSGSTVSIKAGSTPVTLTISKPLKLMGFDGNVTIGR